MRAVTKGRFQHTRIVGSFEIVAILQLRPVAWPTLWVQTQGLPSHMLLAAPLRTQPLPTPSRKPHSHSGALFASWLFESRAASGSIHLSLETSDFDHFRIRF